MNKITPPPPYPTPTWFPVERRYGLGVQHQLGKAKISNGLLLPLVCRPGGNTVEVRSDQQALSRILQAFGRIVDKRKQLLKGHNLGG